MKPLQELLKGKVVNCQTEEEAKEFLRMAHEQGFRWHSGYSLIDKNYWNTYKGKTCYILIYDTKTVFVDELNKYYKIVTYQQFKQLINENNMETKEVKSYTLDELKSEVDKFRDYLLNVCSKNKCAINVEFEYNETISTFSTKSIGIETKINIF